MRNKEFSFLLIIRLCSRVIISALLYTMCTQTVCAQEGENGVRNFIIVHGHQTTPILLNVKDVDSITFLSTEPQPDAESYSLAARWNVDLMPMLTFHDDDAMDIHIPSSKAANPWMIGGYATTTFPLLQCLNLKGCISMEGQRVGFTDATPNLNYNGQVVKHLQDHHGWEIMAHSMTARYAANVYAVDDINGTLANKILQNSSYSGVNSMGTTCIVDTLAGLNYVVNSTRTGWQKLQKEYIRPYVMDYETKRSIAYNKTFPVDYQWGRLVQLSTLFGINVQSAVMPAGSGSHVIHPLIKTYLPTLFDQGTTSYCNVPPLPSYVNRKALEVGSEQSTDNRYDSKTLSEWKALVDEAVEKNAWLVLYMHGYRPCWLNKVDGELVSHGGTYPDEWVYPILPEDGIIEALDTPPARLGITSWSEWYPCPGTRLYMLYELLQYAISKNMKNVTSKQGFERFGNIYEQGYFNKKGQYGQDMLNIEGTKSSYPHHVVGIDGSEDYKR